METEFVDLLLDNHEIIRIEYIGELIDDFYEGIENAIRRGDTWSVGSLDGVSATYLGMFITRVNMKRVIAQL